MKIVMPSRSVVKKKEDKRKLYMWTVTIIFLIGGITGGYLASKAGGVGSDLDEYFSGFSAISDFKSIIVHNLKYILIIWLFGLSRYLMLGTFILNFYKGFIEGFSLYFILSKFGIAGIKLALLPMISYKLFYIYILIFISVRSLNFARSQNRRIDISNKEFRKYIGVVLVAIVIISIVSVLQSLIMPYALKQ